MTISGLIVMALVIALGIVLARLFGLVLVTLGLLAQHVLAMCRRWWLGRVIRREWRMKQEVRDGD